MKGLHLSVLIRVCWEGRGDISLNSRDSVAWLSGMCMSHAWTATVSGLRAHWSSVVGKVAAGQSQILRWVDDTYRVQLGQDLFKVDVHLRSICLGDRSQELCCNAMLMQKVCWAL
jgi:hypothetical protein